MDFFDVFDDNYKYFQEIKKSGIYDQYLSDKKTVKITYKKIKKEYRKLISGKTFSNLKKAYDKEITNI